jgi:sulfatase maturation enzyme AslB (radical SAM superfamily)
MFTVILTDQCNYECTYCYQKKGKERLKFSVLTRAIDFFQPYFSPDCCISFFGGEPLLAFDELKRTTEYLKGLSKKLDPKIRFHLTTNGSLLNENILAFLDEHRFWLTLSFDGLAQDVTRKKESFDCLVSTIPQVLARSGISLQINSVFTSETIGYLSDSVQLITQMGVPQFEVSFAHAPPWTSLSLLQLEKEVDCVGRYFESRYENMGDVPWTDFYKKMERGLHGCPAGLNQMTVSAQGTLWGCPVFPYYFMQRNVTREYRKFCFGDVDSFIKNPQRAYAKKMANYSELRMDCFSTPDRACVMCRDIEHCWICPLAAAFSTGEIGSVPAWRCHETRILRRKKRRLLHQFEKNRRMEAGASC